MWKSEKNPSNIDGEGNLLRLGADNGAKITITNSSFTNLRLCKGLIVYRKGPVLDDTGLLDYQKESGQVATCNSCSIVISLSTFASTNLNQQIQAIRPLYDYTDGSRLSSRVDSSGLTAGSVLVPLFQNFGSILNVEDFQGSVEFSGCTI